MSFAELKPQMEQLSREEMQKAFAFLKIRLRGETAENREYLSRVEEAMDSGQAVSWTELKAKLGL